MDIAEVLAKKTETENAIAQLISQFMKETNCVVIAIEVDAVDVSICGEQRKRSFALNEIRLEVRL